MQLDNNNMKNLYTKLKPEIKTQLKASSKRYPHTGRVIVAKLHLHTLYNELTMGDIRDLINFADVDERTWDYIDWKYGDKLFEDEK